MSSISLHSATGLGLLCASLLIGEAAAGVVTTLGAPTSTNQSIGNLPSWNGNGDTEDATFAAYIDFTPNADPASRQLIWESGGQAVGSSLVYSGNNTLYLRVNQNGNLSELSWELTANQLNAGELFVSWVFDLGNDELRLLMDGLDQADLTTLVASAPLGASDWTGGGAAAFGDGTSRVGGYSGLAAFFPDPFTSGTINTSSGLEFYRDQAFLPSPVPEPLGVLAGVAALGFTIFRRRRPAQ